MPLHTAAQQASSRGHREASAVRREHKRSREVAPEIYNKKAPFLYYSVLSCVAIDKGPHTLIS